MYTGLGFIGCSTICAHIFLPSYSVHGLVVNSCMLWFWFPTSKSTCGYFHVHTHAVVGPKVEATFCADPGIFLSLQVQPLVVPPGRLAQRRCRLYGIGRLCVHGFSLQADPLSTEGGGCKVSVDLVQNCKILNCEITTATQIISSPGASPQTLPSRRGTSCCPPPFCRRATSPGGGYCALLEIFWDSSVS